MAETPNSDKTFFFDLPIDLCCIIQSENRKILQANSSFEYILGWKPEEVINQTLDAFVTSETDKENINKAFAKLKLGIHSLTFETEFRMKSNLSRTIDWKCYIDADNQRIFAIGRDITSLKEMQKTLANQAHLDQLTGICDRQTFLTLLETELSGAVRYHYSTSIILVDIDHFKAYNDKFGIQKGDECLKQVAKNLKSCLRRKTDFLARLENDEFVVLLTHNSLDKAIAVAEYLRVNLQKLSTTENNGENHSTARHSITVSLGVCALGETMKKEVSASIFLNSAKYALNMSRKNGGNKVSFVENLIDM